MDLFDQVYDQSGNFNNLKKIIAQLSDWAKTEWENELKSAKPSWWGRMALSSRAGGGGGIQKKKIPGGFEIFYPNKGKYNYAKILEEGRGAYNMVPALINGPRSRAGKNGRYTIIGFLKNEDKTDVSPFNNDINSIISKTGTYKDREQKVRNIYFYRQDPGMTGRGNAFLSEQPNKDGTVHRHGVKFVAVSGKSSGWIYPSIKAHNIKDKIQSEIKKALQHPSVKSAVASDLKSLARSIIRKYGNGK
ncbi:hypothetical protein [Leptospira levettii]|uniref:hypothetical protein n=1 Tax=Leptospira levettii TaxID=2023178 RepID=UPI000C299550|nr:hypothetical protein [Leptospira levettii]PJZ89551.1 hypothetical protein CH368_06225 [Leptospira levettii]